MSARLGDGHTIGAKVVPSTAAVPVSLHDEIARGGGFPIGKPFMKCGKSASAGYLDRGAKSPPETGLPRLMGGNSCAESLKNIVCPTLQATSNTDLPLLGGRDLLFGRS
jgi:hypothetical protein